MTNYLNKIKDINPLYDRWLSPMVDPTVETIPPFMEPGNPDCKTEYFLNSHGMRCDEYEKNKVIFAGCEYTMPINQNLIEGWAYEIYKNKFINDSKYIALSYPGASLDRIIGNVFKYINIYGSPQFIFLLAPEINRATGFWPEEKMFKPKIYRQFSDPSGSEHNQMAIPNNFPLHLMALNYFISIRNLESYCKEKEIKLFWTSWDLDTNLLLKEYSFNNYIKTDKFFNDNIDIANMFILDMEKNA